MEFKKILRSKRKELGLTQQEIADIWGIRGVNVSDWERGEGMPEASRLPALAKRLGLSISQLMGDQAAPVQPIEAASKLPARAQWVTDDEYDILSAYRSTDEDGRRMLRMVAGRMRIDLPAVDESKG